MGNGDYGGSRGFYSGNGIGLDFFFVSVFVTFASIFLYVVLFGYYVVAIITNFCAYSLCTKIKKIASFI